MSGADGFLTREDDMNCYGAWRRVLLAGVLLLAAGSPGLSGETIQTGGPQSMEGGRGLLLMQSARTYGKASVNFGGKALFTRREYPVTWQTGYVTGNTGIVGVPLTIGLTDEVDVTGALYGFHDARPYVGGFAYGDPESGVGAARLGVKIRFPFDDRNWFQAAAKLGAMLDTSDRQIDGLLYRWTRQGTDIEGSLLQTFDLGRHVSLHFEEGYVLSGSEIYDDQFVGAAGLDIHPVPWLTIGLEANNRTFDGVSPQSVFQAGRNSWAYYGGASRIGDPAAVRERDLDPLEDSFAAAASLSFRLSPAVTLDLGAIYNAADQAEPKETVMVAAGITFGGVLRSLLDQDRDGINDRNDREPATPAGYPVDRWGISLDSDGDSVPDGRDRERLTPQGAVVNPLGVGMDTDGDGIYDGLDREPGTPRGYAVDRQGVSLDTDGDGIPDGADREPGTPKEFPVDRHGVSLDTDSDGVPDGRDRETNTPEGYPVDIFGVALDDDGDGVPNGKDAEPGTPRDSLVDQYGRALKEQERILVQEGFVRLTKVYFASGRAELKPESYDALNGVVELLRKYPFLKIEIQGHTDATGSREKNIKISLSRALAVMEYILNREPSLSRNNFSVVGKGPDNPIATNATAEGRQLNRRVEFVVLNKEELKKLFEGR